MPKLTIFQESPWRAAATSSSTVPTGAADTPSRQLTILGWSLNLGGASGVALHVLVIVGEVLMLSSIYQVMPTVVPPLATDRETVAVIAGDLGLAHRQET